MMRVRADLSGVAQRANLGSENLPQDCIVPNLVDLLSRGYFPKELPPPFTSASFAAWIGNSAPAGDFAKTLSSKPKIRRAKFCRYSLARGGLLRRPLAICHPVAHYLLCKEIVGSWAQILPWVQGTAISSTDPEDKTSGRAVDGRLPQSARSAEARQKRLGRRYILQADVSRFYSSIYTHSIPWAMHTKPVAKANKSKTLLGNRLDALLRLGQDDQTIGIPIGPDTSLVIAEMLMQRCDQYLEGQVPGVRGFRFIDDVELSFMTQAEAEEAHQKLEACLSDYELALNPRKTLIRELPLPLEARWATELKRAKPRKAQPQQAADLGHFFDIAFSLHSEYPGEAVLQFAISILQYETIQPQNWSLFQKLLMLCSLPEPACFPWAIRQIIQRVNAGAVGLIPEISEVANSLILSHSPLRHSSEVANAVYACLALGLTMEESAVDAISKCDDPVVALLALDCEQRNLVAKPLDKTLWSTHMNADGLYDEFWLLAYEANVKNWLPNSGGTDFVATDPNFSLLKAGGVRFYDATMNPATAPVAAAPPTAPGASGGPDISTVAVTSPLPEAATAVPPAEPAAPADPVISA